MAKKRTAEQFFDDAETGGLELLPKVNTNNGKVSKHLEDDTEINHNRMLSRWDEWVFCLSLLWYSGVCAYLTCVRLATREETLTSALVR